MVDEIGLMLNLCSLLLFFTPEAKSKIMGGMVTPPSATVKQNSFAICTCRPKKKLQKTKKLSRQSEGVKVGCRRNHGAIF